MAALKHKVFGTGEIVRKEANVVTVRFEKDQSERKFFIPDSFDPKHFVEIDADLQNEINAAIEARKEAKKKEREERALAKADDEIQKAAPAAKTGKKRSSKTPAKVKMGGVLEDGFEQFLIKSGYRVYTSSGLKSTVFTYIRSIYRVLDEEGLTWQSLKTEISNVIPIYDVGGAKEHIGSKSKCQVINALRRFEEFVNNSTP